MRAPQFCLAGILAILLVCSSRAAASPELFRAIEGENPVIATKLLEAGANPNVMDSRGRSALMAAIATENFDTVQALLRYGAVASERDERGNYPFAYVDSSTSEGWATELILRSYARMQLYGEKPQWQIKNPGLVLVVEPTVDHAHPKLKEHYYLNEREAAGKGGADDDGNGFVDDIYGWSVRSNAAHACTEDQRRNFVENPGFVKSLLSTYSGFVKGDEAATREYEALQNRQSRENPFIRQFGVNSGFTDGVFLDQLLELSHGTHVAGIAIQQSAGQGAIHTLSWDAFDSATPQFSRDSQFVDRLVRDAVDREDFKDRYKTQILLDAETQGRIASRYIRATGAGVVNLSLGSIFRAFRNMAEALLEIYEEQHGDPSTLSSEEIRDFAWDLYAFASAERVIPVYENPNVLFVMAAGNEGSNNDETFQSPAYLARFFDNVLTVGACNNEGLPAEFSNYGKKSVSLFAPGVAVDSLAPGGREVTMDGTSMAAPAVSGLAARIRVENPQLTASEVAEIIQVTAQTSEELSALSRTGAAMDAAVAVEVAAGRVPQGFVNRGMFYAERGEIKRALSLVDGSPGPKDGQFYLSRGTMLKHVGEFKQGAADIHRAATVSPDDSEVQRLAGWSIFNFDKEEKAALRYWERAESLELQKSGAVSDDLLCGLAIGCWTTNQRPRAVTYYKRLMKQSAFFSDRNKVAALTWPQKEVDAMLAVHDAAKK